jgi:iron complex transport system ATP-binding protein
MTLAAHGLDYGYPRRAVGRGLDVSFPGGRIVALLGANGSGKTTLLRTLLGLLAPLAGEVTLDGRPLRDWRPRDKAARLAYVPQSAHAHFDFTLQEMVEMGRSAHHGVFAAPGRADRERALDALEQLGIGALAARPVSEVSGGERQLALIARALATDATHLLMDEPAANLDFGNQALVLEQVARLRLAGIAVVFSTHQPDHALRIADDAVMLRHGAIVAAGPAATTLDAATLSSVYGRALEIAEVVSPAGWRQRVCVAAPPPLP